MALRRLNKSCCSSSASTSLSSSSPAQSIFKLTSQLWRRQPFSTNTPRDLYQVLGVKKTAEQDEIKKAFYTLSKRYHPDAVGSSEASTKKFLEIKHAYDMLKDEQKRHEYNFREQRGFTCSRQWKSEIEMDEFLRQWEAEMDANLKQWKAKMAEIIREYEERNKRLKKQIYIFFGFCYFIIFSNYIWLFRKIHQNSDRIDRRTQNLKGVGDNDL